MEQEDALLKLSSSFLLPLFTGARIYQMVSCIN